MAPQNGQVVLFKNCQTPGSLNPVEHATETNGCSLTGWLPVRGAFPKGRPLSFRGGRFSGILYSPPDRWYRDGEFMRCCSWVIRRASKKGPKLQNGLAKAENNTTSDDTPGNQEQITGCFRQPQ